MKASIISFPSSTRPRTPKKTQDNRFDVRREYTKYLTRPSGKPLSAIQVLLLDTLRNWAKNGEAFTTYKYLLKSKFFYASTKQTVTRNLKELENYINWTWKKSITLNGRRRFNVIIFSLKNTYKDDIENAEKKLQNESKKTKGTHQKCRVKLIKNDEVYIKHTNTNSNIFCPLRTENILPKEKRKSSKKNKEMIMSDTKLKQIQGTKDTLKAIDSPAPPTEENIQLTNQEKTAKPEALPNKETHLKTNSKVLNRREKENHDKSPMKEKQSAENSSSDESLRKQLNIVIHRCFEQDLSVKLQTNLVVKSYSKSKVTLQFKEKVDMSTIKKTQLRNCIKEVYGKNVDIFITSSNIQSTTVTKVVSNKEEKEMFFTAKKDKMWEQIKKEVLDKLGAYKPKALAWLEYHKTQVESFENDKLIIRTTPVCADYIHELCNLKLVDVVKEHNISIELLFGSHKNEKFIYQ